MAIKKQAGGGLLTGGLKTGGLTTGKLGATRPVGLNGVSEEAPAFPEAKSVFSEIADNYEAALSGAQGPEARFAALLEVVQGEIASSQDKTIFSSSGGARISGFRGMYTVQGARESKAGMTLASDETVLPRVPWSIRFDGEAEDYFLTYPGKIYWSFGDLDTEVTIDNLDDPLDISANTFVYLKLSNIASDTPTVELKSGNKWTEHPKTFKTATVGFIEEVTEAFFPLWEFFPGVIGSGDYGAQITATIWGKHLNRSPQSVMIWGIHNPDINNSRIAVPVLVPLA